VDVVVAAAAGMQVDAIAADADRVREMLGSDLSTFPARLLHARLSADVLLEDGELGLDAPRFANIGILGQAVFRADDVVAQAQASPPCPAVPPWRAGLHPVQARQAQLLGSAQVFACSFHRDVDQV